MPVPDWTLAAAAGAAATAAVGVVLCRRRRGPASSTVAPESGGGGAAAAAAASAAGLTAVQLGNISAVPKGSMKEIRVGDRGSVLLVHTDSGAVYVTGSKCTHYGAPLEKGVLAGERIVCPWHAACFNAKSGDIEDGPVLDGIPSYPATVDAAGEVTTMLPAKVPRGAEAAFTKRAAHDARSFVIVGGGAASLAAVETLRQAGFAGSIAMVCAENSLPYDRPKLSKAMDVPLENTLLRKADAFEKLGVTLYLGKRVVSVNAADSSVCLDDGKVLPYSKLMCATGGIPRRFVAGEAFVTPGADLGNIFPLREYDHAASINAAVTAASPDVPIVIVGSSFIGMEVAAHLTSRKFTDVTVLGMEDAPFERVLGKQVGTYMRMLFESRGVKFRLGSTCTVATFNAGEDGKVGSVTLRDGSTLPARVVVIGAGIIPQADYLKGVPGVEVMTSPPFGVRVDEHLKAAENIYCAGDMAYFPYAYAPEGTTMCTRIEHWDVAYDQGRVAALNMLGKNVVYNTVPFFWTQSFGKSLRYAGHCHKYSRTIVHGSMATVDGTYVVYYVVNDTIVGVATLGRDPQAVAALELIRLNAMPSPSTLDAEPDYDLVAHLKRMAPMACAIAGPKACHSTGHGGAAVAHADH